MAYFFAGPEAGYLWDASKLYISPRFSVGTIYDLYPKLELWSEGVATSFDLHRQGVVLVI